jgi:hypothetical protein
VVGQIGASEQGATEVAQRMADTPGLVAVVGMGLSDPLSAAAAEVLAAHSIPMVSDLITAEGFDQTGSAADAPDYSYCADQADYAHGVGRYFFYRVAFRNATQIDQLFAYLRGRADFIITPDTATDPSPCTALPLFVRKFGAGLRQLLFTPQDATTVAASLLPICQMTGDVTVLYSARARDLGRFLDEIVTLHDEGRCTPVSITVASISDGSRIRSVDTDSVLDQIRTQALNSSVFRSGYLKLVYTPLASPEVLAGESSSGYPALLGEFARLGFDRHELDDGWGINAYDALNTVTQAVNRPQLLPGETLTPTTVRTIIAEFTNGNQVPGAALAPLFFDSSGNRSGAPAVVRVCPGTDTHGYTSAAEVYPVSSVCPPS